jgi:hypothetical protein
MTSAVRLQKKVLRCSFGGSIQVSNINIERPKISLG